MNNKILFGVHIFIVILVWASPFLFNWKILMMAIIIHQIHIFFFKGCILTNLQFKEKAKEMTIYTFVMEKMKIKTNRKKMKFIASKIMPIVYLLIIIIWQIILNKTPLIF